MLRFLRNGHQPRGAAPDWVQIKLEATKGARDAIGARVTVRLKDGTVLTRVLKAGEGFLTQTSKWLHFGLGPDAAIDRVVVRWPGRGEETITGIKPGRHFLVREGEKSATALSPRPPVTLAAGEARPLREESIRARAGSRMPAPRLPYASFALERRLAGGNSGRNMLINLWATWCAPCVAELKEFAAHHAELRKSGIELLALSVDGIVESTTAGDPHAMARKLALPFACGRATPSLIRRVEKLRAHGWGVKTPLPIPSSLLLDGDGRLVALYLGPVSPKQILADVALVSLDPEAFHDASMPFPGKWIDRPNRPIPLALALDLMEEGDLDGTREFVSRAGSDFARHREFATLMVWIGGGLMARGQVDEALESYAGALAADGDNIAALNNLAWQRAAHPDESVRNAAEAIRCAEKAAALTNHQEPAVLDTLAAAYAQAGRFDQAVATAGKALVLAGKRQQKPLEISIRKGLDFYRRGRAFGR
jgi:peroxiredoxin